MIDWDSNQTSILLNPRMPALDRERLIQHLPKGGEFSGHFWFTTSGTTSTDPETIKCVALSKQALLVSAAAVNKHLGVTATDRWLNPLPTFHVGGVGILARSHLSQSSVVTFSERWDPIKFSDVVDNQRVTLSALVPTQVYDLVKERIQAPSLLRAIIVGGGALSPDLYDAARKLGWPLLPSYGLTESSSQVATASLETLASETFPKLRPLDHVTLTLTLENAIAIQSASLLTTYAFVKVNKVSLIDPKEQGRLVTEDYGRITEEGLIVDGRRGDFKKIGGESVNISQLNAHFQQICLEKGIQEEAVLIPYPDERLGHVIHLVTSGPLTDSLLSAVDSYNKRTMPFAIIRKTWKHCTIPRTPLGKINTHQLIQDQLKQ